MAFFTVLGIFVSLMALAYFVLVGTVYVDNKDLFQLSVHGFGVMVAKSDRLKKNMNTLRKTENQKIFATAPTWFNLKVWNVGGVK